MKANSSMALFSGLPFPPEDNRMAPPKFQRPSSTPALIKAGSLFDNTLRMTGEKTRAEGKEGRDDTTE